MGGGFLQPYCIVKLLLVKCADVNPTPTDSETAFRRGWISKGECLHSLECHFLTF